jgi:glycosyltransferase involved in cell wall biosynthesis
MPSRRLKVVGTGPNLKECQRVAAPNIEFVGFQPTDNLGRLIARAQAFVFAAEEDFGIAVVEAQACGTPVICYGKGGATETVIPGETGVMFYEQSVESICDAVDRFELDRHHFHPARVRENAERFSAERFRDEFLSLVDSTWQARTPAFSGSQFVPVSR